MKKWAISAIVYLLIVVGGYALYTGLVPEKETMASDSHEMKDNQKEEADHGGHNVAGKESENHGEHGVGEGVENDVKVDVQSDGEKLTIKLTDKAGNPVTDLEVNHEKILHLIVVDEHLDHYYHLHPDKKDDGVFEVAHPLTEGTYKAFVDIKPKDLDYAVTPVTVLVGEEQSEHSHPSLVMDSTLAKTVNGNTVTLKPSPILVGEPVVLNFELDKSGLEPYLGAMGHVVILDEEAENYLHVHPQNENEPVFETEFDAPGKYKIWAEFKHNGKVNVYSYIIEVK